MKRYLHTPEEVVQALKEGKIVKDEYGRAFALKNGFIIQIYAGEIQCINSTIYLDGYKYHIECPEPLKLEVGKFYKTRDGRKAWVVEGTMDDTFPFRVAAQKELAVYTVTEEGKCFSKDMSGSDLIAPWEEAE